MVCPLDAKNSRKERLISFEVIMRVFLVYLNKCVRLCAYSPQKYTIFRKN